jgi:hypothetical protein
MAVNTATVESNIVTILAALATIESQFTVYAALGDSQNAKSYDPLKVIDNVKRQLRILRDQMLPGGNSFA